MAANRIPGAALLLSASLACAAAPHEAAESLLGADQFLAGGTVGRTTPVQGDLFAAGGHVDVDTSVQGDAIAAGGNVRIAGNVGQSLYAAGGRLQVDATIARNARIAGGRVELAPAASVGGNVSIAGGEVTVRGPVKGYLQASGGTVLIDAAVDGDVVANGGRVELGPGAKIGGAFRYRSREELVRHPAAIITGPVQHLADLRATAVEAAGKSHLVTGWFWSAGLLMLAALVTAAVPPASMRVSGELRTHPGLALLFGFIALVCIPVAAVLLLITIVGIPLALVVVLVYVLLMLVGYVATAVGLGELALARLRPADAMRSSWRVLAAVAAMLVLTLVARIPFVGGLVVFFAMIAGIGAILMALRPRRAVADDAGLAAAPLG